MRNEITNEIIIDLYFKKNLNRRQCAEKLECSQDLIAYRLKKMGLNPKSMSECVRYVKQNSFKISKDLIQILTGELLGDGSLVKSSIQAGFRESFGHDKKEWADYLISIFKDNNIPIVGSKIYKRMPSGKSKNITWSFSTINTIEFESLHKDWYLKNDYFNFLGKRDFVNRKYVKIVPINIELNSKALLHWYIGDSSVYNGGGCILHTEGFSKSCVEFLRFKLFEYGIKTSRSKKNTIYIPKVERLKMLEIMGECPVKCYNYKWNNVRAKSNSLKMVNHINMNEVERYILSGGTI